MAKKEAATESKGEATTEINLTPKEIGFSELLKDLLAGYGENGTDIGKQTCNKTISDYLKQEASKIASFSKYNVIVLHDDSELVKGDCKR